MNHAFILQPEFKQPANRADQRSPQDRLTEACGLAQAIDPDIVHHEIITIARPRAATLLGPGVVERIAQNAEELNHPLIIINASLTPVQHRNLERALSCKVIDRTALILEIFGARAQSHAVCLQVELLPSPLKKAAVWCVPGHILSGNAAVAAFWAGLASASWSWINECFNDQIKQIKKELADVKRTRTLQRANRQRSQTPAIALVGYTNAGKSTLFNRLTGADVLSKDMLFATLDPTIRGLNYPVAEPC